ncbi:MAG: hypothetical protein R3C12_19350 [Planctomycetaceae bacterium]
MATAGLPGQQVYRKRSGTDRQRQRGWRGNLSGDAGTESLTIVSVTDLTFAAAVHDLDTLTVQTADTITFGVDLDDIPTLDLTATTPASRGT